MELIRLMGFLAVLSFALSAKAQTSKDYLVVVDRIPVSELRWVMTQSGDHGVNAKSYWSDSMEQMFSVDPQNATLRNQASLNYLRLLRDVSIGIVDPALAGVDIKLTRKKFPTPQELTTALGAAGGRPNVLLESMSSQMPQYLALRESLRKLNNYCVNGLWPVLPKVKKTLKLGSKDPVLIPLKTRMSQLGYPMNSLDDVYDDRVVAAVNDIQWNLRFKPDSKISPGGKTWKYLNVSCLDRMRQVRLDMEKLRWFPQYVEDRYIFVNLAMSYLSLIDKSDGGNYSMSFRTINGRATRKSPTMKDKIVYIVINPFWVVPPTIFREDKVEEIKNLYPWEIRQYFDTRHYQVWNKSFTQRIDPASIDWYNMDPNQDVNIYIRQQPHRMNALGSLKFMMTNSYAIYLHDTNQRELFVEPQRLLSSGCVRVEKPVELAEYLLKETEWDRTAIERYMAKPGEVLDDDTKVQVKKQMPVYMVFLTSQLSSDGVLRFAEDTYKQGTRLLRLGAW